MDEALPHPSRSDIRLVEIHDGRWRVMDRRFRETNPHTLLGFIERVDGGFAAMDLRRESEPVLCSSLDSATAAFLPASIRAPSLIDAEQSRF